MSIARSPQPTTVFILRKTFVTYLFNKVFLAVFDDQSLVVVTYALAIQIVNSIVGTLFRHDGLNSSHRRFGEGGGDKERHGTRFESIDASAALRA